MSKVKLMAATLAIMAFSAVPAYAQVSSNDFEFDLDAEDNNIAVQNSGGNAIFQSNENNQNAQYNSGDVEQNNEQENNALIETGDNEAAVGDVSFFGGFFDFFDSFFD